MLPGIRGVSLKGSLARRLLAVFALAALLPVMVASVVSLRTLNAVAEQRQAGELRYQAKTLGMAVFSRLEQAAQRLRTLDTALPDDGGMLALSGEDSDAFADAYAFDIRATHYGQRFPVLTASQHERVLQHRTVLTWGGSRVDSRAIFLVRASADLRRLNFARLNTEWLFFQDSTFGEHTEILVTDTAGTVLVATPHPTFSAPEVAGGRSSTTEYSAFFLTRGDETWLGARWELFLDQRFASLPWRIAVYQRDSIAYAEYRELRMIMPLVLVGALVLAILLGMTQLRRYLGPLQGLTAAVRDFSMRRFDAEVRITTNDELQQLGDNFNGMARSLRQQFGTLQTMAEIDRLLLASPGLEQILDALLARVAKVVGSDRLAVLLHDTDTDDHARMYRYTSTSAAPLRVERVAADRVRLERATDGLESVTVRGDSDELFDFVRELPGESGRSVQLWPLRHSGRLCGFLCLVAPEQSTDPAREESARGFADRLSVALANLSHVQQLQQQAHFDSLTGLANRELFRQRLAQALCTAGEGGPPSALLYIDLDQFKRVNDTAGHGVGDRLLESVAQRLQACVRREDTVARLGGDEFAIILNDCDDAGKVGQLATQLLAALAVPHVLDGIEFRTSASIGIAFAPRDGDSVELLLRNSDIAMYRAKDQGRGRAVFFSQDMHALMQRRLSIEAGLRTALVANQLQLRYQPIVSDERIVGCEALLRWIQPSGAEISPALFIPVAEDSDLIVAIGDWVLQQACRDYARWRDAGIAPAYVSVNVAPRQLRDPDIADRIRAVLDECRIPPTALQLEITESAIGDSVEAERRLRLISLHGVRLALDDFGTGYSSLSHLHRYPFNVVKIDRSFVLELTTSRVARQLVRAIIQMALGLDLPVIAEGVQSMAQRDMLLALGCHSMQGYLYSHPVPIAEFERQLRANPPSAEKLLAAGGGMVRRL